MIKLTEDDFGWSYCGDDKHVIIDIAKHPRFKNPYTVEEGKEIKQQILDDYEKARKWDYMVDNGLTTEELNQELTLTELIEKRIEELGKNLIEPYASIEFELQKLLEENKK